MPAERGGTAPPVWMAPLAPHRSPSAGTKPGAFKSSNSKEQRATEARRVLTRHEGRVPVIVEAASDAKHSAGAPTGARRAGKTAKPNKFLVPATLTLAQFVYVLRKRLVERVSIQASDSLWVFLEHEGKGGTRSLTLPPTSAHLGQLYDDAKDDDGFLYLAYSLENVFG